MKKLPKIGQRVVVKDNYTFYEDTNLPIENIVGQTGEVAAVDTRDGQEEYNVLVKFDNIFSIALHNGRNISPIEDCWWLSHKVIKKLPKVK